MQNSLEDFRQAGEFEDGMFLSQLRNSAILIVHSQLRKQEGVHGVLKTAHFCWSSAMPVLIIITIPGHFLR